MDYSSDADWDISSGSPPPEFVEDVRLLLEHLYDIPFIQQHPLTTHPMVKGSETAESPSKNLRTLLISAIDALKMSVENVTTRENRYYNLVYLHYVDGMTTREAAHQLDVSLRQAYRDLQRGTENVASLLWERLGSSLQERDVSEPSGQMSVHSEVARLVPRTAKTELGPLLRYAARAVERLAAQNNTVLEIDAHSEPAILYTEVGIAQQTLVRVLSQVIQAVESQKISVKSTQDTRVVRIQIVPGRVSETVTDAISDALAVQLLARLGWSVESRVRHDGEPVLSIVIPTDIRVLLVIDDNEGMAELLERYLTDMPYRVTATTSAREGLQLARDLSPSVIVLDIMMPDMDGWELMQRLRHNPNTSRIPILVCSVFNDPELAYSLGATAFLPKPLSRDLLINALLQVKFWD